MAAKKKTSSSTKRRKTASAVATETEDLRKPIDIGPKAFERTLSELDEVLGELAKPEEPQPGSLVDALIHAHFLDDLPCGVGQEVRRRIDAEFVDRNEFRVAEAYEVEGVLIELGIPELFKRCHALHEAVQQVYNDQNSVSLDYLREASISERKMFFQRIPAIGDTVAEFLVRYVDWEEVAFSDRSTVRVQARLGLDAKNKAVVSFVEAVREKLAPFGHVPLQVGAPSSSGKPKSTPPLSPACLLMRLSAKGK